jgi:hypothetical protein
MDKYYFFIFIATLLIIIISIKYYSEKYVNGYTGALLPRERDRDNNPFFYLSGKNNRSDDESNDQEVQHINLDEDSGHYIWNSYLNFPYGGYIYNSSYPVYMAKGICPDDKPYYNTIDGKCIYVDINIVKNTPSGAPNKIFSSDLPGYVYEYTPSVFTNVVS